MQQSGTQGFFSSRTLAALVFLVMASISTASGSLMAQSTKPAGGKVQEVSFDLQPNAYAPITVQKGLPVRWVINATARSITGCNNELVVPSLGIRKKLKVGANLIEFTPTATGQIKYSCWMGMIRSTITVVDRVSD